MDALMIKSLTHCTQWVVCDVMVQRVFPRGRSLSNWPPPETPDYSCSCWATVALPAVVTSLFVGHNLVRTQPVICNRTRNLGRGRSLPAAENSPRGLAATQVHPFTYFDRYQQYYLIMHFSQFQKSKLGFGTGWNKGLPRTRWGSFSEIAPPK